jgi:molybdopterin converting factor small subunit
MSDIQVRYFAAAREAVGLTAERLDGTAGLAGLIDQVSRRSPAAQAVLGQCSYLVNGVRRPPDATPLPLGATVDVLPPFAGG